MSTPALIAIVATILVLVGAWLFMMQRRTRLKKQFGPEYERAVLDTGNLRKAESLLDARARRVRKYEIRELSADERARFAESWRQLQTRFMRTPSPFATRARGRRPRSCDRHSFTIGRFSMNC